MANKFTMKSFVKDVEKQLSKDERRVISKASGIFQRELRSTIKEKGLVDTGNLLKGVSRDTYQHSALVGMSAPGQHAYIVEYGTLERRKKKNGAYSGVRPATPFFLPAYRAAEPAMIKALSEEW